MLAPTVTVLMAVYDGEKHIGPTIESILNQTFKDFEFVIVNDASTDSTERIIKSYGDSRIVLHNNKSNLGQTKSLNIGLHLARGKYIARTDAGDVSLPMRLEKQVIYIENHPEITVVGASAVRYNDSWRVKDVIHMPNSPKGMLQRMFFASPVVHVSVVMNRETILHLGGYNEDYHILADYELWSKLLQNNCRLSNLREVLVGYMASPESLGAMNIKGKSIIEASRIIQSNVNALTSLSISLSQASNIYELFALDMIEIALNDVIETEKLFTKILKEVNSSKSDIDYFLIRKYMKYLLLNIRRPRDRAKFQHAIRSVCTKAGCLFSFRRLSDSLCRLPLGIVWRSGKRLADLHFPP